MAKRTFIPFGDPITADDLNRWEYLRVDIFSEPGTKDEARSAIGAAPEVHNHSAATPSVGGIGGAAGFISATDLELLRRFSAYPSGTSLSPSGTFAVPMLNDSGSIVFVKISDLQTIFGSGGEGGGTTPSELDGGESETSAFSSEFDGGESETSSFATDLNGGGA